MISNSTPRFYSRKYKVKHICEERFEKKNVHRSSTYNIPKLETTNAHQQINRL